jgi:O-methyltransferase domain/Bacterial transcriptional activator domain
VGAARDPNRSAEDRVALLRQALALWRGPGLAGLAGDWVTRMRDGWAQERLDATVAWAQAELRVGNAQSVLAPLSDFRQAVDCTADLYLLKQLIHFYDDETSVRILRNCAAGANPGARIVANERVIDARYELPPATLHDVMMFVVLGEGRDRTEQEYADLFRQAGLRHSHVTDTPSGMCWIEAVVEGR